MNYQVQYSRKFGPVRIVKVGFERPKATRDCHVNYCMDRQVVGPGQPGPVVSVTRGNAGCYVGGTEEHVDGQPGMVCVGLNCRCGHRELALKTMPS